MASNQVKRRHRGKRNTKPRLSNNPFLVYSIYFQKNQNTDKVLEQKIKPWEKDYLLSLNQRMRGAQSVTAGDQRSMFNSNINKTMNDLEKNQITDESSYTVTRFSKS